MKKGNFWLQVALFWITGGWWVLIYGPYYFFIKKAYCPVCGNEI